MRKNVWRTILALVLCCSLVLNVFAATTVDTVENPDGSSTVTTTTVENTETSQSMVVVKVETSAPDADGNRTVTTTETGEESSVTTGTPDMDLPDSMDVTVALTPGQTTTGSASDSWTTESGDRPVDENDKDYDYTETTVSANRDVTATTTGTTITTVVSKTDLEAFAPEDYEGKNWDNKEGLFAGTPDYYEPYFGVAGTGIPDLAKPEDAGYDYQWTGYSEATNAARAESTDIVFAKDENGNPILDENDEYVVESTKLTGKYNDGFGSTPTIFTLTKTNEDGTKEYYYAYCIDNDTEAIPSSWYSVSNLEDSDYYPTDESAAMLRAVVTNGYWGQESGNGSMEQMKQMMADYYGEDGTVTILDKNGNPMTFTVADVLDRFTEADALTATQAAIWSNSNGTLGTLDGQDGTIITGIYSVVKPKSNLANCDRDYDYERDAVLTAAYEWLMSLEGEEAGTVVINDKNFVDEMTLTVGDRAADNTANLDTDNANDVYNTDLNFKLAFIPGANDDLLVHISYTDLEGNPVHVVRRLAGALAEGEEFITADENGVYVLSGLQLGENNDIVFDLRLEGVQYLEQNVYIYSAYGGAGASQTMVGIAEGSHTVDVNASMTLSFSVDENAEITTEHFWGSESEEIQPELPGGGTEVPEEDPKDPVDPPVNPNKQPENPKHDVPTGGNVVDIEEEDVPLADVPNTGDASFVFVIMAILSACGLAYLALTKKRENV